MAKPLESRTYGEQMKIKVQKIDDQMVINIPEHIIEALDWTEDQELKMEVARDFDLNATTLVITKRRAK